MTGGGVSFEGARAIPGGGGGNPSVDNMLCASATGGDGASPISIGGAVSLDGARWMPGGGGGKPSSDTCVVGGSGLPSGTCARMIFDGALVINGGGGGMPSCSGR